MKILDRYILKTFLKTFISVFVILMLIFVLQAIWLYIKELAGKDLDVTTILKFLFYITPTLIPLILPLTILLSSIMVFGNFAENYEFAAMKSTGISLQRAMKSLSIFIGILAIITFIFSNNVIPWAQYESHNLRKNIAKVKPAMVIAEGQFSNIGDNLIIKVDEKSGKNGKFLKNVIIHQKTLRSSNIHITTIAKSGEITSSKDSDVLKLILYDGYYYDDTPSKNLVERRKHALTKTHFKKYVTNFDLSNLNKVDLDEKQTTNKYTMLDVFDLNYTIDSLKTIRSKSYNEYSAVFIKRTNIGTLNENIKIKSDTLTPVKKDKPESILNLFKARKRVQVIDYAINSLTTTSQVINGRVLLTASEDSYINRHAIAMHKKFALAAACIILFFVGAPLGALIRKGGMGLPMVIAIVLFLTYHFIGLFAENSAETGNLNPVLAAYFSSMIMLPLSIFLTRRATADRGIFEFDHIIVPLKKKLGINSKNEEKKALSSTFNEKEIPKIKSAYKALKISLFIALIALGLVIVLALLYFVFKNNKLPALALSSIQLSIIAVIVYLFSYIKSISQKRTYAGLTKEKKPSFLLVILAFLLFPLLYISFKSSRYTFKNIKSKTEVANTKSLELIKVSQEIQNDYKTYKLTSLIALISNVFFIVTFVAYFILKNNKLESLGVSSLQFSIIALIIFIVYYIKSLNAFKVYITKLQLKTVGIAYKAVGFILFPILYKQQQSQIKS